MGENSCEFLRRAVFSIYLNILVKTSKKKQRTQKRWKNLSWFWFKTLIAARLTAPSCGQWMQLIRIRDLHPDCHTFNTNQRNSHIVISKYSHARQFSCWQNRFKLTLETWNQNLNEQRQSFFFHRFNSSTFHHYIFEVKRLNAKTV